MTGKCSLLFPDFLGVQFQVVCLQKQESLLGTGCFALISVLSHASSALTQLLLYSGTWESFYNPLPFVLHLQLVTDSC